MCKNFLIGRCKYGLERCYFSHSKAYLPSGIKEGKKPKWWETRDSLDEARELYDLWQDRRAAKEAGGFRDAGSEEWDDSDDEDDGFDGDIDPEQAVEELFRDLRKTKNEAIARGAAAPGWQNSGSARRTGQERGSELVDLLKRELDLGYTEAEFEHLCVNGVNPYTDYPEVGPSYFSSQCDFADVFALSGYSSRDGDLRPERVMLRRWTACMRKRNKNNNFGAPT